MQKKCFTNDGFDLLKSSEHALKRLTRCLLVKKLIAVRIAWLRKDASISIALKQSVLKHKEKTKVKLEIFIKRKSVKSRKECVYVTLWSQTRFKKKISHLFFCFQSIPDFYKSTWTWCFHAKDMKFSFLLGVFHGTSWE